MKNKRAHSKKTPAAPAANAAPPGNARLVGICLGLFLFVLAVFYPVTAGTFINYDDNDYVTENVHVQGGLVWRQILWAFTNTDAANWHPLTWLSHMLDCQLYGANPWGHHLTSVLIHAANAVLLFLAARALTGALWRSLFAALLFALHPLRVESVAWIAERKDVLSTFFWLLAIWSYSLYVKSKSKRPSRAAWHYALVLLWFVLGLMCKPMLVTLPFALLLLDYWPLRRWSQASAARLVWEKTPLFLLAAAGSVTAFLAQKSQGAVIAILPFSYRAQTAIVACVRYLGKFLYPVDLAILYPHPKVWAAPHAVAALALLLGISAAVFLLRRARAYGVTGWLWYLGTLVPVIGLVQIGSQSMADRYTYIPGLGLIFLLTWGACDLAERLPGRRVILGSLGAGALIACVALTRHQITFWKDSGAVFSHAIEVTDNAFLARKALADFYATQGRLAEAETLYRQALEIYPNYEGAHLNLAIVLNQTGRATEAIAEFKTATQLDPTDASTYNDLGAVLGAGHLDESIALFKKALEVNPHYADAHKNLGRALDTKGDLDGAVAQYQAVLRLRPDPETRCLLGQVLEKLGRNREAMMEYSQALRYQPNNLQARQALERLAGKNN